MTMYVPLVGQFDNLGDIFLRRRLAAWIPGDMQVLVGSAPADFVAALALPPSTTVHRSFGRWAAAMAVDRSGAGYVYKPGEIQMSAPGMKEHVGLLPLIARLRASGGSVARVGVGTRSVAQPYVALCRPSVALCTITLWRDEATRNAFGRGRVAPDLAFGEGSDVADWEHHERSVVAISLRGDKPLPSDAWFESITAFAARRGLEPVAVSQVRRDDARTRECARRIGGRALAMDGSSFSAVEDAVRLLYRQSALVVSDRLHVLVGAATEGAPVSALLDGGSIKIRRHFDVLGLGRIEGDTERHDRTRRLEGLENAADSVADVRLGVQQARRDLANAQRDFHAAMSFDAAELPGR
ncbi:MAG: hypothetical protein WBA00_01045 [Rhodococcus sp. (in: high G+C Gram-positive bacteria)]